MPFLLTGCGVVDFTAAFGMGTGVAGPLALGRISALGFALEGAAVTTGFSSGALVVPVQLSQLESHGDFCVAVVAGADAGGSCGAGFFDGGGCGVMCVGVLLSA